MAIYVGPPGALQSLTYTNKGASANLDLGASPQRLLSGVQAVDFPAKAPRTYQLERKWLTADDLAVFEGLALGLYGAEPYALIDPWRRNMLTAQQSSAGDLSHDTTGFSVLAGSDTVGSTVGNAFAGLYHQQYLSAASGAAGTSGLLAGLRGTAAQVITPGNTTPVLPNVAHTFQAQIISVAGTAASWRASILWYDTAGALISTINGTAAVATGAYVVRSVTATSPANAAYAVVGITNNATLVATNTLRVDQLMLDMSASVRAWVPGTGTPRVAVTDLGTSYPQVDAYDATVTMVEVG